MFHMFHYVKDMYSVSQKSLRSDLTLFSFNFRILTEVNNLIYFYNCALYVSLISIKLRTYTTTTWSLNAKAQLVKYKK